MSLEFFIILKILKRDDRRGCLVGRVYAAAVESKILKMMSIYLLLKILKN